jgi:hypothetical protein
MAIKKQLFERAGGGWRKGFGSVSSDAGKWQSAPHLPPSKSVPTMSDFGGPTTTLRRDLKREETHGRPCIRVEQEVIRR